MASEATPSHPATMDAQLGSTIITSNSPLPDLIITTPRLIIRPMHPQDATSLQEHASPASIAKYMSLAFSHPYTLSHAETWIAMNLTAPYNNFCICKAANPHITIGSIGLKPGSDTQAHTAEIGYWIGEPFWGKGYATEALAAMTDWTFTERGETYRRLWGGVFTGNVASVRCLEKCAYRPEGIMRGHVEKHGVVSDLHLFGLTKKDWDEARSGHEGK